MTRWLRRVLIGAAALLLVAVVGVVGYAFTLPEDDLTVVEPGDLEVARAVDAFLASIAGYLIRQSLLPPPPGLPTLRPFQAAQGEIARRWLAERLRLP